MLRTTLFGGRHISRNSCSVSGVCIATVVTFYDPSNIGLPHDLHHAHAKVHDAFATPRMLFIPLSHTRHTRNQYCRFMNKNAEGMELEAEKIAKEERLEALRGLHEALEGELQRVRFMSHDERDANDGDAPGISAKGELFREFDSRMVTAQRRLKLGAVRSSEDTKLLALASQGIKQITKVLQKGRGVSVRFVRYESSFDTTQRSLARPDFPGTNDSHFGAT